TNETGSSFVGQILNGCSQLGVDRHTGEEIIGALSGGVLGLLYGTMTALLIPLSATNPPAEELAKTVAAAAAGWAVLGGFGGWAIGARTGVHAGIGVLLLGLLIGSALGGMVALLGELFGAVIIGALNGGIGGAFFGAIAAHELIHKHFP